MENEWFLYFAARSRRGERRLDIAALQHSVITEQCPLQKTLYLGRRYFRLCRTDRFAQHSPGSREGRASSYGMGLADRRCRRACQQARARNDWHRYRAQVCAASILQPALQIFIAKLGLVVGGSLPVVFASG